ncbi:nucleotide-diphospho-sugar transferase [Decorospora gaudefroyi]|uniref:glycogenin glucosyltransferase n=1 Tax=Decorospora gaudefroyi TaxID=184978 RepID=A0A6A5KML3_9PLEO|nr:nucleotide-diphospho-sugar transferase [Decorospora gaudefroyi]
MARPLEDAYITLLMSDSYLPGAAVLAHSLRDAGTTKKLAVLITLDTLSADTVAELKTLYDYLIPVERIRNPNPANLYVMGRPDLAFAFTKIALWRQTQFRKLVYLDADVVALRALDELFDIDAPFAAAPDIGWPDAFNSGVMVISPDMGEYWALQTMAATGDSFDGADQGLLNQYFEHRPWQRLKFTYNCTPNAEYQWEPAYRYYKRDIAAVHFIGKNKPWSEKHTGGSGVYGELLARWWAVHQRHMHRPKAASGDSKAQSTQGDSTSLPSSAPAPAPAPEAPAVTTEPPMTEPGDEAQNIDQGVLEPTPTVQQRKFSAPEMQWDATKSEPPAESKPEAANFPTQTYTFSDSRTLFQAPHAYPEAPRDMWYKLPETKPKPAEKPKPIFPWEREADRPAPTRVFAEDLVPPEPTPAVSSPTHPFSTVHYDEDDGEVEPVMSSHRVSSSKSAEQQWQSFQQTSVNAWDSVPGIENYVRAISDLTGRRGKTPSLRQSTGIEDLGSPLLERRNRRESLILTDFPSAVERPSLPVTPAPVRRPMFWGEERNETGELPSATGVPDQTEWDPEEKLDQLRRSSLIEFEHLRKDEHPNPPLRALPEHSVVEHKDDSIPHVPLSGGSSPHGLDKTMGLDGANDPVVPGSFPIAEKDFADKPPAPHVRPGSGERSFAHGDESSAPQHYSTQDFSQGSSSTFGHEFSSSTAQPETSHDQSAGHHSLSSGRQIQAGKTTFTVPTFGDDSSSDAKAAGDDILSPTQSRN